MSKPDEHPWDFPSTDWGAPALYTAGELETAGASAEDGLGVPGRLVLDQPGPDPGQAPGEVLWSDTTYAGPRRHRPGPTRPDRPPPGPGTTAGPATAPSGAPGSEGGRADRALLTSSRTMAIASLASRITGFLRSAVLAAALGVTASRVADSYNVANTLPNQVYELLIGGVLTSVVVPLVVHAQEHDRDGGVAYTQRLLSIAVACLGVATLIAVLAAPLLAWAYGGGSDQRQLTSIFATLLLPEIFFYGLGAFFAAVLNTRGIYGPPAWAPVLNNVITIATVGAFALVPGPAVLTTTSITNTQVLVLGIGTTLGIAVQALFLLPYLRRSGFHWRWRWHASGVETTRLGEVRTLAGWVLGYVVISQAGLYVVTRIANNSLQGGVSAFLNADLLFQVPYGIVGVSLLTALMPRMSRSAARGDIKGVVADLSLGTRLSAVGLVPISAGLIVMGPALTTVLFFYGRSTLSDARLIGTILALGAFGLLPFAIVMLQMRVFYATRDARSPTVINAYMVGAKVILIVLAATMLHGRAIIVSLGAATSVSYLIGAVVGHRMLTKRFGPLHFGAVGHAIARSAAAAIVGAGVALLIVLGTAELIGTGRAPALLAVVGGSVVGGAIYLVLARALHVRELQEILASLRRS